MIDWKSTQPHLLINPRMPVIEKNLWINGIDLKNFEGHVFLSTSGSTSLKFVALHKNAFLASANAVNDHLNINRHDVWANPLPVFHVGGLSIFARAYLSGSIVVNYTDKWSAENFYSFIIKNNVTVTALVPTQLYDLVISRLKSPDTLRAVIIGGGFLESNLYKQARSLGWNVLPSYGMTEMCSQVATASLSSLESEDYPEMQILEHMDIIRADNGCLMIKSPSCFSAYASLEKGEIIYNYNSKESYFKTKDVGFVDNNHLFIEGRISDFIKIGGESVNLLRLNQIFDQIKAEKSIKFDVVIADVKNERLGNTIHLFSTSSDCADLLKTYNDNVLPFERIRKVHILEEIPRSALNKLLKKRLLEMV